MSKESPRKAEKRKAKRKAYKPNPKRVKPKRVKHSHSEINKVAPDKQGVIKYYCPKCERTILKPVKIAKKSGAFGRAKVLYSKVF